MSHIELRGVRVHNLKGIDVRLPLGKLIAITGVSGAGKSSLAFDTLVAEGRRRYIETFAASARQQLERIERPDADALDHLPPAVAFRADVPISPRATLGTITEGDDLLGVLFARLGQVHCPKCQSRLKATTPEGVARAVQDISAGLRIVVAFPAGETSLDEWRQRGFVRVLQAQRSGTQWNAQTLELAQGSNVIDRSSVTWVIADRLVTGRTEPSRWQESVAQAFQHGGDCCVVLTECQETADIGRGDCDWDGRRWRIERFSRRTICLECEEEFPPLEPDHFSFESSLGACPQCNGHGVVDRESVTSLSKKRQGTKTRDPQAAASNECSACDGSRLQPLGRSVRIENVNGSPRENHAATLTALRRTSISQLAVWLSELVNVVGAEQFSTVRHVSEELADRLHRLIELGLGELSLSRSLATLSRGELLRARLAGVLATRLDNALYVFEEPSSGLHPRDAERVLAAIQRLHHVGNTVILIEHNRNFVRAADEVLELGPAAGQAGGQVVYQGSPDNAPIMLVPMPPSRSVTESSVKASAACLSLSGVTRHNLQNFDVCFPLNTICVLTGVSGSGKSSLIEHTLFPALCERYQIACSVQSIGQFRSLTGTEHIDEVVLLDASPIRRSLRANAATLLGLFATIRQLFAESTESKLKNFTARSFSFNSSDSGRCPRCRGLGAIEIDMQFLASLEVVCPECHGARFQRELLEAKLRGLSIAEVLNLSADEAFAFFRGQPLLQRRLKSLKDVGLGYLPLGQPASTLSRGECQRLKLASRLSSSSRKRTLFLLDEPTAGLHPTDILVLLEALRGLVEIGHSIIATENRAEFVAAADHVIEMPGYSS